VPLALAGALLAELALAGAVRVDRGGVIVCSMAAAGDVLTDRALAQIVQAPRSRAAALWVDQLCYDLGDIQQRVLHRLAERGVLTRNDRRILGLLRYRDFLVADREAVVRLYDETRAAALGLAEADRRTCILLGLLRASGHLTGLASDHAHAEVEQRVRRLVQGYLVAAAVTEAVSAANYTGAVAALSIFASP
jgi:hypothetical protein